MKSIGFFGTILEGTDSLIVQSLDEYLAIQKDFVVRIGQEDFEITNISEEEKWLDFKTINYDDENYFLLSDNKQQQIYRKDLIEIILPDNVIDEKVTIKDSGKEYREGDGLVWDEGGGKCIFLIDKVKEGGEIESVTTQNIDSFLLNPAFKTIEPKEGSGNGAKFFIKIKDTKRKKTFKKDVKNSVFSDGLNFINFEYPFPKEVEKGQIKIKRTTISLNKPCLLDYNYGISCVAEKKEFTNKLKIPIVKRGTINAYNLYNEGSQLIEDKLIELENRLIDLENRI